MSCYVAFLALLFFEQQENERIFPVFGIISLFILKANEIINYAKK